MLNYASKSFARDRTQKIAQGLRNAIYKCRRRRTRYRCDLVDEPGEHFAIVPFSDGDRGLAAILLFHAAGGGPRPPRGPEAKYVCHGRLCGDRGRRGGSSRFVLAFQSDELLV